MRYRLDHVDVLRFASISAAAYAALALVFIVPFALLAMVGGAAFDEGTGLPLAFGGALALVAPVLYGLMGFITGALGALLYNLVAKVLGGAIVTLSELDRPPAA